MTESNHLIAKSFLAAGPVLLAMAGAHQVANASTTLTIQKGDTLSALAEKYQSTVSYLSRSNNILNPDLIFAGASLTVPDAPVETTDVDSNLQEYTVQAGDSLSVIADRFGTSIQEIIKNSHIDANDVIRPGQVVKLRASTTQTSVTEPNAKNNTSPEAVSAEQKAPEENTVATSAVPAQESTATANNKAATTPVEQATEQPSKVAQTTPEPSQPAQVSNTTEQKNNAQTTSQAKLEQVSPTAVNDQSEQSVAPTDDSSNESATQENTTTSTTPIESTTDTTSTTAPSKETAQIQPVSQPVQAEPQTQAPVASGDWRSVAESLIGTPYVWGGKTPESGLDCSGFVAWVLNHSGRTSNFPSYTVAEEAQVQQISVDDAQPGDLLFWGEHGATYHVAIYLGNGQFIAAPEPGDHVRIQNLSRGWRPSFAGRV